MLFDDSFEHEAWHRGEKTRIVLVFDVWHPDLTDREVQFLSFLQKSRMRAEMAAEKSARAAKAEAAAGAAADGAGKGKKPIPEGGVAPSDDAGDNFYQLLQEARDILPDNSWWT